MTEHAPGTAVGPPAGWYNDPGGAQVLRWWDGMQWGQHTQPLPGGPMTGPESGGRHRGPGTPDGGADATRTRAPAPWAWVVAAAPLIALAIAALASTAAPARDDANCVTAGWLIGDVIGFIAAGQDAKALVRRGEIGSAARSWLALLGGWPYLWARAVKRTGRTNTDWWLLAGGIVVWVAAVVVSVPLGGGTQGTSTFNQSYVQSQISQGIQSKTGDSNTVSCPKDPPMSPGSTFECVATFSDQSTAIVKVTIQDADGDWIWQVVSS